METRSKRRKRQRLISIASNVSSWPDVPATFESLNDDTLTTVLEFVGRKSYATYGGINYHCKEIYITSGMTKYTFLFGYGPLSRIIDKIERAGFDPELEKGVGKGVVYCNRRDVMDWALQEQKKKALRGICKVAAGEERLDILEEVWNNIDHEKHRRNVFYLVDVTAAFHGKLNVLKWVETKGLSIHKEICAREAAYGGQLHILEWLKEERGLELFRGLYYDATAKEGNLDILQWLHDEGCPWPDYIRVREDRLKPEVVEWCRSNGYTWNGNLNILQWLHDEEGCPWSDDDYLCVPEEDVIPEDRETG